MIGEWNVLLPGHGVVLLCLEQMAGAAGSIARATRKQQAAQSQQNEQGATSMEKHESGR
jgi:hypothetical protein